MTARGFASDNSATIHPDVLDAIARVNVGHAFGYGHDDYTAQIEAKFAEHFGSGARVRNYDGLGGQLLFAYLHRQGFLHWTDNQLTIEWERVADGVASLRHEVEELYRQGIDRTKLQHWAAAHDLVAASVPAAVGSQWAASVRDFTDVEDPRPYVDLVRDDEFPLSIFYSSLKAKLAACSRRGRSRTRARR